MSLSWGEFNQKIVSDAVKNRIPVSGTFELTARCNFQCKMCYICQKGYDASIKVRERSSVEWIRMAEEARDAGMFYLLLTGGEVFIRQDFKEIYEELSKMGFQISIYSNGSLITPDIAKWLGKIPPYKMSVTLYGASPETYYKVTGFAEGFEKALHGIDNLIAEGIHVGLRTTVVQGNEKEFCKIAELVEKRNLDLGVVNYIGPRRESGNTDPIGNRLAPEELVKYEILVDEYNKQKSSKIESVDDSSENTRLIDKKADENTVIQNNAYRCNAGKCIFWIAWDGHMHPCGVFNEPVVYPFENGFIESWKELVDKCNKVPVCKPCLSCEYYNYCIKCPSRIASETGFFDKPAPYLCETAKLRYKYKVFI